VTNPNDFEDIALTNVTDSVDNGGQCSFTPATQGNTTATVQRAGTIKLDYVCTYTSVPSNGTNTATATWDKRAANTPDGSATGTAAVAFGPPTKTVNASITPTDAFNGGSAAKLCLLQTGTPCTLTATDPPAAATTQTYTYTRSIPVAQDKCISYPNTASDGVGDTSQATVTVCGGATGGLTMGFWQNKNGQGVITSFCQGPSGGQSLYAYLTQFNPFKDLTSTACADIATYVNNVVKAANASGASMNAMLKAQMLATALDVYFSQPNWDKLFAFNGGNNVSLGGVKVDLTNVCVMCDGSGGSATCGGTFANVSAAFNSQPSMTISDMLSWASNQATPASATNPLASPWYGQN
jgi:hypothetical protein